MTQRDDWVGDVGHLTLADSSLGELLIDMLRMLDYGHLSAPPKAPDPGLTTGQAVRAVQGEHKRHPRLCPEGLESWLRDVVDVTARRNEVMHAVARNRCVRCGTATAFHHPRSGHAVDRSAAAVQALTREVLQLIERGRALAGEVADLVNRSIILGAMLIADDTGESVFPETVIPDSTRHTCGDCNGDGRATASLVVRVGAVEVKPTGRIKALLEERRQRRL